MELVFVLAIVFFQMFLVNFLQIVKVELLGALRFLVNPAESGFVTGVVLPVDGGWTCGGFARDF